MSDGEHESPVEEREESGIKASIDGRAVGTVSIEKSRIIPVSDKILLVDERDRHGPAIWCGRINSLREILCDIVSARNLILPNQFPFAGIHMVVDDRMRCDH